MFNGKRIKELEKRVGELEDASRLKTGKRTPDGHFYGMQLYKDETVPLRAVVERLMSHLGVSVVVTAAKPGAVEILLPSKKIARR
jgi:hypothetical protein